MEAVRGAFIALLAGGILIFAVGVAVSAVTGDRLIAVPISSLVLVVLLGAPVVAGIRQIRSGHKALSG